MTTVALALIALVLTAPEPTTDPLLEAIVAKGCYANHHPDRAIVAELLKIEAAAGISGPARGLTAAAACNETGFHKLLGGDWRSLIDRSRCKRGSPACGPASVGMLQLGSWAKRKLRRLGSTMTEPRFDWRLSARVWAEHVVKQRAWVIRECPNLRRGWNDETPDLEVWRAAHKTAVRNPNCARYRFTKKGKKVCAKRIPRCHKLGRRYSSSHWAILAAWKGEKTPTPKKWKGVPRAVKPKKLARKAGR